MIEQLSLTEWTYYSWSGVDLPACLEVHCFTLQSSARVGDQAYPSPALKVETRIVMEMQRVRRIAFCLFLFSAQLFAQSRRDPDRYAATGPLFEASAGYLFTSMTSASTSRLNLQGIDANGLVHFTPHWGAMVDFSFARAGEVPGTGHSDRVFSGLIGPMFYLVDHENTNVFVNALFGSAWVDSAVPLSTTAEFHGYETRFSYLFGAGWERHVTGPFSVRVSGGFQRTTFVDSKLALEGQNHLRVSAGVVYQFGRR